MLFHRNRRSRYLAAIVFFAVLAFAPGLWRKAAAGAVIDDHAMRAREAGEQREASEAGHWEEFFRQLFGRRVSGDAEDPKSDVPCEPAGITADGADAAAVAAADGARAFAEGAAGGSSSVSSTTNSLQFGSAAGAAAGGQSGQAGGQSGGGIEATFRLCGTANPQAERAIEQLVGGGAFSATLTSRQDGCADLTIKSTGAAPAGVSVAQRTNLSVNSGGNRIDVRVASENGVTRVTIGGGQP
ncbi:MAG: hypothetical protein HY332_15680 [Chloroflexi bacterium]|nr:hypothetical protein [Chloroflexota bacterium]